MNARDALNHPANEQKPAQGGFLTEKRTKLA